VTYLLLALGLALLIGSGEFLVRGSVGFARAVGLSPLFIGLTLVGFGTSAPELVASLIAAFREAPGIAVGNVVGSNIANVILILGVAALIAPLPVVRQDFHRDALALAIATAVAVVIVLTGSITRPAGALLVLMLVTYIVVTYRLERDQPDSEAHRHEDEAALVAPPANRAIRHLAVAVAALVGVVIGAKLLVDASIVLAARFGVPEAIVGLTIVAVGTSLPELAVSAIAAYRGQGAVAVGNVVGSNLYNVLGILGATALVHPLQVPPEIADFDIWVMLSAAVLLLYFMVRGQRIGRVTGAAFLVAYLAYILFLFRS
jgi:cation:H+ antiporter